MKYQNLKRPLAVILAFLLSMSSCIFVASAQEVGEQETNSNLTYTLKGESSNEDGTGDYVVELRVNGDKINTGYVELEYDPALYSEASFELADSIADASYFWDVENTTAGKFAVGFMSGADSDVKDEVEKEVSLLGDVTNPSTTAAYIDASGDNNVLIGTFTFKFAGDKSYADAFTTLKEQDSTVTVASAKYSPHDVADAYNVVLVEATEEDINVSNMLVFTAEDFTLSNMSLEYNGTGLKPTVAFKHAGVDVDLTDKLTVGGAAEQENVGKYDVALTNVSADGYYLAAEITFEEKFEITKRTVEIPAPQSSVEIVWHMGGVSASEVEIEDWTVLTTGTFDVGEHTLNIQYDGRLDTDNNIYKYNGNEVTSNEQIQATVTLKVTPLEGSITEPEVTYTKEYNSNVTPQSISGYGITPSVDGWVFEDPDMLISTTVPTEVNTNIIFVINTNNFDYSHIDGYVEDNGVKKIVRPVKVYLTKAPGTAPTLPTVKDEDRLASLEQTFKASDFVTNAGVWSYTDAELSVDQNTITFTYTPNDQDNYDYEGLENWVGSKFVYEATVTVLAPYFDPVAAGIYPPAAVPSTLPFEENKTFTETDFLLTNGWEYGEEVSITSAVSNKPFKVLYAIPEGYDGINPSVAGEYHVDKDNNIVSYVELTVSQIDIPNGAITFEQVSPYTGNAIELLQANITINGLTDVNKGDVTLTAVAGVDVGTYDVYAEVAETTNYNGKASFVIGTLEITAIDVTTGQFTINDYDPVYDGNAKTPGVTAADGVAAPTVKYYDENGADVVPTDAGTYTVKVSADAFGNYKEYTDFVVGTFEITKKTVKIEKPANLSAKDYEEGGVPVSGLAFEPNWSPVDATETLNAGVDQIIEVKYDTAALTNKENIDYVAGTDVTGNATDGFESFVTITINKIPNTTIVGPNTDFVETFNGTDKKVSSYISDDDLGNGWTIVDGDALLDYKVNEITVKKVVDTDNYTYEDYDIGEGFITTTIKVTLNKAQLPDDAASVTSKITEYTGSPIDVTVTKNNSLVGLGDMTIDYSPADHTNAGTYDVIATFTEGDNYLAGTITFDDALTITPQKVDAIELPEELPGITKVGDNLEAIAGTELSGTIANTDWSYEEVEIIVGDNTVTITQKISAEDAKNYDYTDAATDAGVTITPNEETGELVLTKTYDVTGKKAKATFSLIATTNKAEGSTAPSNTVITITPEGETPYTLTTGYTEIDNIIDISNLELEVGKYTISVKKQRYLEYIVNFELTADGVVGDDNNVIEIELIAGDIIGGPVGNEVAGDGVIDIDDFEIVLRAFSHKTDVLKSAANINEDDAANVYDLGFIKKNFSKNVEEDSTHNIAAND